MGQRIYNFIISLVLLCLFASGLNAQTRLNEAPSTRPRTSANTQKQKKAKAAPEVVYPLFNGVSVGVDLIGPGQKIIGNDYYGFEAKGSVNLLGRYFPTLELGYGKSDMTDDDNGISYKVNAPFTRLGIDYNFLYKKAHGNLLLLGFRYGFSSFDYDVIDPYDGTGKANISDDIWKDQLPYSHTGMKASMHWLELAGGVRAKVWKQIYMGWSLRFRFKLSASVDEYGDPYYVPGYGKYGGSNIGLTYHLIYQLPFKKK